MKKLYNNEIYQKLYNFHTDYIELRQKTGKKYEKYTSDVLYWKIKYLEKLVNKHIPEKEIQHICEIGCATGLLLDSFMKDLNCFKSGIDISNENINCAKKLYPKISFHEGTFDDFLKNNQNEEKSFDIIILSDIIEHVEDDVELLNNAGKHSKYLIMNLPLEKVLEYQDRAYGINDREGHLRAYDLDDAINLCKNAKMEILGSFNKRYVKQPVFRKYLLDKLLTNIKNKVDALVKYEEELNYIDLNPKFYKSNFFALLTLMK